MKKYVCLLLLAIIGCTNPTNSQPVKINEHDKNADSIEVVTIVKEFFKSFDDRDLQKMNELLDPSMKIIHHNGATTNREEMIAIIKETKNWWPRTRKLSEIEFTGSPNMAVVGILNEVIFSLPNNKTVEERYRETWIFKKTGNQWKPVRCHYSKIMVDKHSEEVN
ncbi:nuclear transport factor 2 family protein [Ferruginibacter paludis]|uniref:nuclear transport factor 2 family protein n=1 Tax=Ferruginibacter paludis TaxID=1310417 RepID=UPI0025B3EA1C|nr:nuclear transport factor 2 family protein [Ferruginibacter paludis]MDN3657028.1 nuclear transport factor 2 family protein [Ferruginibacter paludis]